MLIDRLWRSQPGKYFCISTKSGSGKWRDTFFARREMSDVEAFVAENRDKDIYFCPHGFSKPRRVKENAVLPTLLWADLDECDPRGIDIKPTIAIESSPGRFVGLWFLDKTMTEDQNRRLSYLLKDEGNDTSGWDLTQVLRVPGTTNYKYEALPKVKTLWIDGPEWKLKDIEKQLPDDDADEVSESDLAAIYKKYEKTFPAWLRRELINGKPTPGTRSEMIYKLEQELIERGVSRDEAFHLIKASPWNKFKGRRNEDKQLRRELDKAINKHFKAKPRDEDEETPRYRFLNESMSEVEEENLDWMWYPYLARGELTILEGDPGLGKSYLAQIVAGKLCDGEKLPSVKTMKPVEGKVAYFDMENSPGSVTKKRLVENGIENMSNFYQEVQPFSIDDHERLQDVYDAIERIKPILVVFDTVNSYIGKSDTYKASETTQAFGTFKDIAVRFDCAVLCLRHLTKSTKEKALYRGQGSIAFSGTARVVITVGALPDDDEMRAFAVTKINVAKPPKAMSFRIKALPDTMRSKDRSKFEWGEFLDLTSDDLISTAPSKDVSSEKKDAMDFLKGELDDGPVEARRIESKAEARSISTRTLYRAADELGVKRKSKGFGKNKTSMWSLPEG
jgi:archaellum biogenesis ATPase FlaH